MPLGILKRGDASRRRSESFRIFRVDAALDAVAANFNSADGVIEIFSCGQTNLRFDQVYVRHHFGDGVLHLNARIHFDEVKAAVFIAQKFHRARVGVANFCQSGDHLRTDFVARFFVHHRRGRFFN